MRFLFSSDIGFRAVVAAEFFMAGSGWPDRTAMPVAMVLRATSMSFR
jgi:hypothetical protein